MVVSEIATTFAHLQLTLSTVESCTGGAIAAKCTDLPGSSAWFIGGLVTYSNEMKIRLGVEASVIESDGAVSEAVVLQMAEAGKNWCDSDWCISVSGVAGPGGGSVQKPVGTVWVAWSGPDFSQASKQLFYGNRQFVREQAVQFALQKLVDFVKQ